MINILMEYNEDEKIFLNQFGRNISKEKFEEQLCINIICAAEEAKNTAQMLLKKVKKLNDSEWCELQKFIPMQVSVSITEEDMEDIAD